MSLDWLCNLRSSLRCACHVSC